MAWNEDLSYGNRDNFFGDQDYFQALKRVWDSGQAGADRQRRLAQTRQDILSWMGQEGNQSKIDVTNRLGEAGGLGQRIVSGDLTHVFQGAAGGSSKDWFGDADLWAGRAAGHSFTDIKDYLDQGAPLRDRNVKGGGGLYDQVATEARFERQQSDTANAISETNTAISDLIGSMDTQFAQQTDFQRAQLDWQKEESAKQREHEAMLLAEQRKVKTATPTHVKNPVSQLAIGPGKVAAPQSASSLARKRLGSAPLVTGLNIGTKKTSMNIR